jgi:hypothetical protein
MNNYLSIIAVPLFFIICEPSFAGENTNVIALSDWSEPVGCGEAIGECGSLRGRLLIQYGFSPNYAGQTPETQVYLELQNVSPTGELEFYFDPREVKYQLLDANSNPPPQVGMGGSGGGPSALWVTLLFDSKIQLRASLYGFGMQPGRGLMIPLGYGVVIEAGNTNDYYLTATFTADGSTTRVSSPGHYIWQGTLKIPKTRVYSPPRAMSRLRSP